MGVKVAKAEKIVKMVYGEIKAIQSVYSPKCLNNGQSAAKSERKGSTTIPIGSTFKRMEVVKVFIEKTIKIVIWSVLA